MSNDRVGKMAELRFHIKPRGGSSSNPTNVKFFILILEVFSILKPLSKLNSPSDKEFTDIIGIFLGRAPGNWQKRRQYEGYAVEWPNSVVK